MTINKPNRTEWKEPKEERIRLLRREQEEREARRSLKDFLRHREEEDDDHGYTPDPFHQYP